MNSKEKDALEQLRKALKELELAAEKCEKAGGRIFSGLVVQNLDDAACAVSYALNMVRG